MDETDEQFEERVLNKRAYQMFMVVRNKLHATEVITLSEMCHRNSRKQVFLRIKTNLDAKISRFFYNFLGRTEILQLASA